jgi:NAD+ kinase
LSKTLANRIYAQKIKNVAIVFRKNTPAAEHTAKSVSEWFKERKIRVFSHPEQKLPGAAKFTSKRELELVVVLGGDGTYLEAVRMLDGNRVPVLGFNMGGLGFLTVTRADEVFDMLELAIKGNLEVKSRSMISIEVDGSKKENNIYIALNDLVIDFNCYCGRQTANYRDQSGWSDRGHPDGLHGLQFSRGRTDFAS